MNAQAAELLRCAADLVVTGRGVFVAACRDLDVDLHSDVAELALNAWDCTSAPYATDEQNVYELLEAAQRLDEGEVS